MDADQTAALVTELLSDVYTGKARPAGEESPPAYPDGWILQEDGVVCFIKTSRTSRPFVWIRVGAALEIPRSEDLALYVATANKDLDAGRAYLRYGPQFGLVAVDETVNAAAMTREFAPSIQNLIVQIDRALEHARDLQWWILERFGGRPFASDDWLLLVPDLEGTVLERRPAAAPAS